MKRFITIFLLLAGICAGAQTIGRKAVLTKGQRFELATTLDGEFELSAMGQTEKMSNRSTRLIAITVEKVLDTTYQLSSKLVKKTRKSQSSSENLDFDSDKPGDSGTPGDWEKFIKGVGAIAQVLINKQGQVISRGDTTEDKEEGGFLPGFQSMDNNSSKTYELFPELPAKSIKVGDSWTDSTVNDTTRLFCTYTLSSLNNTEAVTVLKATISFDLETVGSDRKISVKFEGTVDGTATFDPKTGIIKEKDDTFNGTGVMTIQSLKIPIIAKLTNSVRVKPLQP